MFKRNDEADICGTSLQGYVTASYSKLVEMFGQPADGDGCKVSTEWAFTDESGNAVTLYDYKQTSMYDDGLPSVAEFRARSAYEWHIGAKSRDIAQAFKAQVQAAK